MATEVNAAAIELVAQATNAKVVRAIKAYKESADMKDEAGKASCDAFEKGFEECKRKVFVAFNLLDLSDISTGESRPLVEVIAVEKIDVKVAQEAKVGKVVREDEEAANKTGKAPVRVVVPKAMAETEAIITTIMEAIKSSSFPIAKSKK